MPKIGRNDPCPCGSGKKYKHCCRAKDEAAEHAAFAAARAAALAQHQEHQARFEERQAQLEHEDELAHASNAVVDLVHAHPELYDPEFGTTFQQLIAKLDPPAAGD